MAKKTKSLKQWCLDNNQTSILTELDSDKNEEVYARDFIPDRIEYNSPYVISWICEKGHRYSCEVVGRTLFNLGCPICNPNNAILPIGAKYGCLTITDGFGAFLTEVAEPQIQKLLKQKEDFLHGIRPPNSNIDSADFYDRRINDYSTCQLYKCQCKCGKTHYRTRQSFLESRHRFCTKSVSVEELDNLVWTKKGTGENFSEEYILNEYYCGSAVQAWNKKQKAYKENGKRTLANNYDVDFTGRIFESLEILGCVDDDYEEVSAHGDLRTKNAYYYTVYKRYRCCCYLCGKEHIVKCSQFHISPPAQYGRRAYDGYWSGIECDCHKISSFQWIVNKILIENDVSYRVEYSFPDLIGCYGLNKLKFDFAIMDKDGSVKALIECQGEQHYMPVKEFGGNKQFDVQVKNDEHKRAYVKKHNIELIEISYKDKKIEKIESILRSRKII